MLMCALNQMKGMEVIMKIQEIKKTKTGKYRIALDDQIITTYDDVILKNSLLYKKEIDASIYEQILCDHRYYEAYNQTLSYILKRIRCTREIEVYLEKFDLKQDDKINIINHLKEVGLIDDKNYVRAYISDSINLKSYGPYKMRADLMSLNIPSELVDCEIEKIDKDVIRDNATKIIGKKIKNNHKYSEYQLRHKITIEMVNLGYSSELITNILDSNSYNDSELLEKEYDRLFIKLSRKYSGYDLSTRIKQKLYSKGFDINKINEIISQKEDEI